MSLPWQIFPAALMIIAIGVLVWNGKTMRRTLGDEPTREEIQAAYPRAKLFPFRRERADE